MGLPSEIDHSIDEAIEYLRRTRSAAKPDIGSTDTDGLLFSVNGTMPTPPCWYAIRS